MSLLPESVISPCYLLQRAKFQYIQWKIP